MPIGVISSFKFLQMNQSVQKTLSLSIIGLLLVTSVVANPAKKKPEAQINKLLIIVLDGIKENRETLELELSYDFADMGVANVLSHETTLTRAKKITKQLVLDACGKHEADGVLLVRLIDVEQENQYSYNQPSQYTGGGIYFWGDYSYAYGNYFDAVKSSKVIIESDVYTVPEAKLVFQERRRMKVGDVEEAIGKFAAKVSKRISKQGILVKKN